MSPATDSSQRTSPIARLAGPEIGLIGALSLVAALVLGFGLLAQEVLEDDTLAFDQAVILALRTNGNPADPIGPAWLQEMGRDITALGSFAFLGFVFLASLGYLLLIRKRALALLMA